MPQVRSAVEPLDARTTELVVNFARACKGAARAVSLYPPEHPAIRITMSRLVETSVAATASGPLALSVVPRNLLVDARPPLRPDLAISELAELLHTHLVGELLVLPGADEDAWRKFLKVMADPPEEIHAAGGFTRALAEAAGHHLEIREIDYSEVLRERYAGDEASWDRIIANCLMGDAVELDDETLRELTAIAEDPARLCEFTSRLEERGAAAGVRTQTAALVRVFRSVARFVARTRPEGLDGVLNNMATAACRLSPELMLEMLGSRRRGGSEAEGIDVVSEIVSRAGDSMVAQFVTRSVMTEHGATVRLAEAFQAMVPDEQRRQNVLDLAHQQLERSPLAADQGFDGLWSRVEDMLTSYTDQAYVSEAYNRELTGARVQALEIERITDDPPERIAGWLATVSDSATRELDLELLLDLLAVERDPMRWREVVTIVVPHVEDLVLIGDFESARQLAGVLAYGASPEAEPARRLAAQAAVDALIDGDLLDNLATHLGTLSDEEFEPAKALCREIGSGLVDPLAELITLEQRVRVRHRLTELLLTFGAEGRQAAEQLMQSANPSVRRTAVYILKEFGGNEALPDLELLLADEEAHVQREAVRALVQIGTDEAYALLERALASGGQHSRDAIMRELTSSRDLRAGPLFAFIVRRTDPRGSMREVYLKAIERLGVLGGPEAAGALKEALYRGDWWAPGRTRVQRLAAVSALRMLDTPEADAVLDEALERGSHGVRAAVRRG